MSAEAHQMVDILLRGTVFADLIFAGLPTAPEPGKEVWARDLASSPGGIANKAVAAARLGARTSLISDLADDQPGLACRAYLEREGVDLTFARTHQGWRTPLTVAMAYDGDRAIVTYEKDPPRVEPPLGLPPARAIIAEVDSERWWESHALAGTHVCVDPAWDSKGSWDLGTLRDQLSGATCFTPNRAEALAFADTEDLDAALDTLAQLVPVVVITLGAEGAAGLDTRTGERVHVPATPVRAVDTTGAGDVFAAALTVGELAGWNLSRRLTLAVAASGLSTTRLGGAASAPTPEDLPAWASARQAETPHPHPGPKGMQ